jgi:hypothetical protein
MKDIDKMNLSELADDLTTLPSCSVRPYVLDTIDRLRVIHEETRWIPVSERMPTEEDGDENGEVLVSETEKESPQRKYSYMKTWNRLNDPNYFFTITHWKRITPPEGE